VDSVERLLAIEDIKQLKARYFRCMDTKDWEGLAQVFSPDAVLDHTAAEAKHPVHGAQDIANFIRDGILHVRTVHHGHMPEIAIDSPTTAHGTWAMEDMLWWPEDGPLRHMHGYGHYHEEYVKLDGEWKIRLNQLTRLRVDVDVPGGDAKSQ
jgi:SnoaL-like domain